MRGVLKALVTVELQLCGDLFLSLGCSDRRKHEIDVLLSTRFVCDNTVIVKVTNNRQIQEPLSCSNVRNIRYPLLIWAVCFEISCQMVRIFIYTIGVVVVLLSSDFRQQIIFLHNTKHRFRILMYSLSFKPYMYSTVAICATAMFLTLTDFLSKRKIPCGYVHSLNIVIVAT